MANDQFTTKFKVDIAELKEAFKEAKDQILLANSEFKKATGGMDDWASSADGLSAKLKQLRDVLDAQKTQLQSLKDQYDLVVQSQGENSEGAKKLKTKMNNLEGAIKDTEAQIETYDEQLGKLKEQDEKVETLTQKMTDATDAFGEMLGKRCHRCY